MRARSLLLVAPLSTLPAAALAQPAPAAAQAEAPPEMTPEALETSRRLFREGIVAAQAGRWAEARDRFSRTLAIRPAPIVRFNLAVACQNTGALVEAVSLYRDFLRDTPREDDPPRVEAAAREIDALARRVARLRVEVTGDAVRAFALDGRPQAVALVGVDIPVDPGPHVIEVTGAAGDRQRTEGALVEGDATVVPITLSPTPPASHAAADWQPRTQSFGRQITRPGADGRWVDWAARATAAPASPWRQRPFTVGVQLGYGAPAGLVAVSLRYFPQPWFGAELLAGAFGAYGPSGAALAHLRFPARAFAIGGFVGLGAGLASASTACDPTARDARCTTASAREVSAWALTVSTGLSAEFRLGSRLTLRGVVGARFLANPSDVRTMDDPGARPDCEQGVVDGDVCGVYQREVDASTVNPLVGLDLGYTF